MSYTVGSLFSGIGGFDLGLERAGLCPLWMCEIDRACQGVLRRHWPGVPIYDDVTRLSTDNLVRPDVLCGGFPCQDVSVAGRRAGLVGERSGLWYEFLRVIESLRPRWVVIENVPGLLSSNGGRDFAVVLRGLVECGYGVTWRVLDAQYFGVAQRRRRVFIVGSLGSGRAAQVLFEREGVPGDTPPRRETGQRVARSLANSSVSSGYRYDPNGEEYVIAFQERGREGGRSLEYQDEQAYALTAPNGGGRRHEMNIALALRNGGRDADTRDNRTGIGLQPDVMYTLQGEQEHAVVTFQPRYYTRDNKTGGAPDDVADITNAHKAGDSAPHVTVWGIGSKASAANADVSNRSHASGGPSGMGISEELAHSQRAGRTTTVGGSFGVRRLTPVECERLQGFPDGWTEFGVTDEYLLRRKNGPIRDAARYLDAIDETARVAISDSTRYRQLGNAVCVNVAEWIGRRIMEADTA